MKWSDVANVVAKVAPMLGAALGGPAGGVVGTLISSALGVANTPDSVAQAIQADPSSAAKLIEIQSTNQQMITQMLVQLTTVQTQEGAQTVRAETASESWITSNWRPLAMLMFCAIILNNYIIAPYAQAIFGTSVSLPTPPDLWELIKIGLGGYVVGRSGEKMLISYLQAKSGK